jgi:uncharacterized protein YndB with AHSA1/START domain
MEQPAFECMAERLIQAPASAVWQAWADAGKWSAWAQMNITSDFRTGGRWNNDNGEGGEYIEITEHRLIRFTWEMKRFFPGTMVDVSLLANNNGSAICRLRHKNLQRQQDCNQADMGWNWAMDSLKCLLETNQSLKPCEWGGFNPFK